MSEVVKKVAIVGGGAAGFFAAINVAKMAKISGIKFKVIIYESGSHYLKKVKVSGGGRCNVTHHCFDPKEMCQNYPRGQKELLSPFQQFQAKDTVKWFKDCGIHLVAESDGRMFPRENTSEAIIGCFMDQVRVLRIDLRSDSPVTGVKRNESNGFSLTLKNGAVEEAEVVLIATGSSPGGYKLASSLGHSITERAPSLFSFKIKDKLIAGLQGLSFPSVKVKLKLPGKKMFTQDGPLLITHWGLSGPAILKLSAWAAREMKRANYRGELVVNWLGLKHRDEVVQRLAALRDENAKARIKNVYPQEIPKRFWHNLLNACEIPEEKQWANGSKKEMSKLVESLFSCSLKIDGQSRFKEEFVECGGVSLKEVDLKSMESQLHKGLYFAGELLDVDGVTGGFNFQNAWTTAWIAARHIVMGRRNSAEAGKLHP